MDHDARDAAWWAAEEKITERYDAQGARWTKVYVGGGEHLHHWLAQFVELAGEENLWVEPIESEGLLCVEGGNERFSRVWVRQGSESSLDPLF